MINKIKDSYWSIKKRATGFIQEGYTNFDIRKKYNIHPNSKVIISVALFGDLSVPRTKERYVDSFLRELSTKQILDGWNIRVYLDPRMEEIIELLVEQDCEIYLMDQPSKGLSGTMWRFLPAQETKPFVTQDADDEFMKTDWWRVTGTLYEHIPRWLKSDKPFFEHSIFVYNHIIPLNAGMWGAKPINGKPPIPDIQKRMEKYNCESYGADESFLTKEVFPFFKKEGYYRSGNRIENLIIIIFIGILILGLILLFYKIFNRRKQLINTPVR